MGYTSHTISILELLIKENDPKSVLDLGAQNLYNQPILPAPYASSWYEVQGIDYTCIDLNGENGALKVDLSEKIEGFCDLSNHWFRLVEFDMLVDAGTSEHIGKNGKFDWEAIYNCWHIKFASVKKGGIIYSENPKTDNWPFHGFNYYTSEFYHELDKCSGLNLVKWGEVCAMGNCHDGKNIWAVQRRTSDQFPSLQQFMTLSLKQS